MNRLRDPWMVAAWPGMGAVARMAAEFLARRLGVQPATEIPPDDYYEVSRVEVRRGILLPPQLPHTTLATWRNPGDGRDLVVLLGDRQPLASPRRYCDEVLSAACELGVARVYTFAAMPSPRPPGEPARVFTCATDAALLSELRGQGVELLEAGEIGGLNGVFLSVAAERGIPGACLLGEFPYFANSIANPKAAAAVLGAFARHTALRIDLEELEQQGQEVDRRLVAYVGRMEEAARRLRESAREEGGAEGFQETAGEGEGEAEREELDPADHERIEALFRDAAQDRSRAALLKNELDRLGVFKRYEDRFLDLFKRAE